MYQVIKKYVWINMTSFQMALYTFFEKNTKLVINDVSIAKHI